MSFPISFLSFFLAVTLCFATTEMVSKMDTEMMENIRPTTPKIYLVTAGEKPAEEELLMSFMTVKACPGDYKEGFSFRCDTNTGPTFPVVVFRTNSAIFKKERKAPYYIAGDTPEKVRPFPYEQFQDVDRIRIACRVRTRKPVWIDLEVEC